jgi:hypothetical protein
LSSEVTTELAVLLLSCADIDAQVKMSAAVNSRDKRICSASKKF